MYLFLLFVTFTSAFMFKITTNIIYTLPIIGMTLILVYRKKYYLSLGYAALFLVIVLIPIHQPIILESDYI